MTKTHKKQHYIPRCYLKAWTDPSTPIEQTPYLWVFPQQGGEGKRRAPHNTFTENEMYTIHRADGVRDLRIEHGLGQLEGWFDQIRRDFLDQHKNLPLMGRAKLMAFVAALMCRTPDFRDHYCAQWKEILDLAEEMQENLSKMTLEDRQKAYKSHLPYTSSGRKGMSIEDVRKLVKEPVQRLLAPCLATLVPTMTNMCVKILCTNAIPGFIIPFTIKD